MYRYTTPTHTFTLPSSITIGQVDKLNISYSQTRSSEPVIEKTLADATIVDNAFRISLSETETAKFKEKYGEVLIQVRIGIGTARLASNIIHTTVSEVLKDAVLV